MGSAGVKEAAWWRRVELPEGGGARWRIGPLTLAARHLAHEWRIAHGRTDAAAADGEPPWEFELADELAEEGLKVERFVFRRPASVLRVTPLLAERPVVSSPRLPLYLLPGEEATLFVGSPLLVGVGLGASTETVREIFIHRPSDTWFGNTREGELCYASRTHASLAIDNLPLLAYRAITPVRIRNAAADVLQVERLKLPVPYLSLYAASGWVWTDAVTMTRSEEGEMASLEVGERPPQARGAKRLASPRVEPERGLLIRAFGSLFTGRGEEEES